MPEQGKILAVSAVSVSFDGFKVLDNLTFSLERGELRFLIGPNGAGKTTFLDIITGKTRPAEGRVIFDGTLDVQRSPEHKLVQQGIARKFQTPTIFSSLTVFENLETAIGFRTSLTGLLGPLPNMQRDKVEQMLDTIGLQDAARTRAGLLSHGQKQWLEIGMLLVQEPKLLLVDEPVAGMTQQEIERTEEILASLAGEHTVVVVEHDMDFVRSIATKVTVLHEGHVLAEGQMSDVQRDPK